MDPFVECHGCQVWRTVLLWELLRQTYPSYTQRCEQHQKPLLLHSIDGHFSVVLGRPPVRTKSQQTQACLDREWDDPKSSWYLIWTGARQTSFGLKGGEKYLFLIKDSQTRARYLKSTRLTHCIPSLFPLLQHVVVIYLPLGVSWSRISNLARKNLTSFKINKSWRWASFT